MGCGLREGDDGNDQLRNEVPREPQRAGLCAWATAARLFAGAMAADGGRAVVADVPRQPEATPTGPEGVAAGVVP